MTLEYFAHALDVQIVRTVPVNGYWGSYYNQTRTIHVHPELSPIQERYVLGHELTHAYYGDHEYRPEWERRADIGAAMALIRMCEWRKATMIHDSVQAVAHELEVHPRLVVVFRKHLEGTL